MTERFEMTDRELDTVAAGQTREHVLLARQVSVPFSARSGDDDAGHGGVITFDFPQPTN